MHSTTSKELGELITERLVLRSWTAAEVAAVVSDGSRPADWAEDFPAEGDRVIAGLLDDNPAWYGPYGHRLIVERDSGLLVGSIGLFWPPTEESWRSGTASSPPGAAATTPPRPPARSPPWPSPCPASTQWPPPRNHPTRLPSASWRRRASSGRTPLPVPSRAWSASGSPSCRTIWRSSHRAGGGPPPPALPPPLASRWPWTARRATT